ncbi:hypothetical protein PoB_004382700 [Plakobranchus ocellatus]|uniref:Uncharacterized protein n=1 Tax=Plakobranchus ocellatus TaxID=259542 RepID=A0AAV4BDQ5_9GAST|nr:hypothetical protein PoB_004382700 [Plakobranchus ocellatus]
MASFSICGMYVVIILTLLCVTAGSVPTNGTDNRNKRDDNTICPPRIACTSNGQVFFLGEYRFEECKTYQCRKITKLGFETGSLLVVGGGCMVNGKCYKDKFFQIGDVRFQCSLEKDEYGSLTYELSVTEVSC